MFYLVFACLFSWVSPVATASVAQDLVQSIESKASVAQIEFLYSELPRNTMPVEELVDLRFRMQDWRARVAPRNRGSKQPPVQLPIWPLKKSNWEFERWAEEPGQDRYELHGNAVHFDGRVYLPGDFLLVDLNDDAGGTFALFNEPRSLLSHFGLFVLIDYKGKRLPAVLEVYNAGLRAVPLNVFVSGRFITYGEIYRLKDTPANWASMLSAAALKALAGWHSYGITEEAAVPGGSARYLTCAKLGAFLLEATGVAPISAKTRFSAAGQRSLRKLGVRLSSVLSPTDYARDPRVAFVDVIDRGMVDYDRAREVLLGRLRGYFEAGTLDTDRLPDSYRFKLGVVRSIQDGNVVGDLLLLLGGYERKRFPVAPAPVLAFVPVFDEEFARAMSFFADRYHLALTAEQVDDLAATALKEIRWWIRPN